MSKKIFSLMLLLVLVVALVPGTVTAQGEGSTYTVQADDWLSKLAEKEYGDVLAYPAIVYYTNQMAKTDDSFTVIVNPNAIEVGDILYLPSADEAAGYLAGVRIGPATGDAAPADEWGVIEIAPGDPIRLGFAAALSGAGVDVLGIDEERGAELAVADRPTVAGHEVELVVEDSLCSGEGGTAVANKFVADPSIVAVVGHMCSSSCIPASDVYEGAHYTMVSPSCTAVAFTARGLNSSNRVCWSDAIQGPAAANFAYNTLGARTMATIHDGSPYGEGLVNETAAAFEALGGTVVAQEAVAVGDTDMRPVLTKIGAENPDIIYFGGFVSEGAFLASQRFDVGLGDVIFMGADGIKATDYITAAGDAAEGTYASAADLGAAGPGLTAFFTKYEAAYGEEPPAPFHAHAYDATNVIMDAIYASAVESPDGTLWIGRKALNDAIRGTTGLQGLSGVISCDAKGDCGTGTVAISKVEGGEFVAAE